MRLSEHYQRRVRAVLHINQQPVVDGRLISVGYINQSTPRAGYYFSFTFTVIGASLLFLSKMYRRSAPPSLFLGGGRRSPSFHQRPTSASETHLHAPGNCQESREKCSQEPLFRSCESANGHPAGHTIRTVHQDVCTCIPQQRRLTKRQLMVKNLRRSITSTLDRIQWRSPFGPFFGVNDAGSPSPPPPPPPPTNAEIMSCFPHNTALDKPNYNYDMEWEEYWNACLGSCNHVEDGDCDLCNSCADCGLPLDQEDFGAQRRCHIHPPMLPDAVDIPELPAEVPFQCP